MDKKEELNIRLNLVDINSKFEKLEQKTGLVIQSLLFPNEKFDASSAKKWAEKHGFKSKNILETSGGNFIHIRQAKPMKSNDFKTISLQDGVKARVSGKLKSRFAGSVYIPGFSKFSEAIKSDMDISIPMPVDIKILCEGKNRDGIITREELEDSLEMWEGIPIIDWHDNSNKRTEHRISDRQGYTLGNPRVEFIDGKMWVIAPGEIINRNLAYHLYLREMRQKPLEVSAEFSFTPFYSGSEKRQINIRPQLITITDSGHIKGNKLILKGGN